MADTYALLGDWQYAAMAPADALPRAKAAAITALELDSTLGEAHISPDVRESSIHCEQFA